MAKKQMKPAEETWHIDAEQDPPVVFSPAEPPTIEAFDPTTEQPIAVDVLQPVVTYMPAPSDPLIAVRLELPMTALFALIELLHPLSDVLAADYYGLVLPDGSPSPIGLKVLAGIDQTALRHKMNAAWRVEHNRRIGG